MMEMSNQAIVEKPIWSLKLKILLGFYFALVLYGMTTPLIYPKLFLILSYSVNFIVSLALVIGMVFVIRYERRPIMDESCSKVTGALLLFLINTIWNIIWTIWNVPRTMIEGVRLFRAAMNKDFGFYALMMGAYLLMAIFFIYMILMVIHLIERKRRAIRTIKESLWVGTCFALVWLIYFNYADGFQNMRLFVMDVAWRLFSDFIVIWLMYEFLNTSQRVQRTLIR